MNKASRPVTPKRNGNALAGRPPVAGRGRVVAGLTAADKGKVAPIDLFLGFTGESVLFELRVKQGRAPARARAKRRAFRQRGDGFENFHQRLRRFETADIQFNNRGGHCFAYGLLNVSSIENCFVARTACGRFGGR